MKKFSVLALTFISFLIISCSKKDEVIAPQNENQAAAAQQPAGVPQFNEANSKKVMWDELPAELKNATPIETKVEQTKGSARGLYSSYRYYVGPWGGGGGSPYYIYPPSGSRIYAMAIRSGALIDRITIWYMTSNGTIYVGGDRGGNGGGYYLQFFAADEYIYYVAGRSGLYLDHLTMYTNRKWFSYGGNGGSPFAASVPYGYQILGIFGGSGIYIDRIGFYVYTR